MRAIWFAISHITVSRVLHGEKRELHRALFEFPSEFSTSSALKRERNKRAIPTQPLEERQSECELWWGPNSGSNPTNTPRGGKCNSRKAHRRTVVSSSKLSEQTRMSRYLWAQERNVNETRDNPHTNPRFFSGLRNGGRTFSLLTIPQSQVPIIIFK